MTDKKITVNVSSTQPIHIGRISLGSQPLKIGKVGINTGIPGPKGENGITPHIGANGNWFIGEIDTEIRAKFTADLQNSFGSISINDGEYIFTADTLVDTINIKAGNNITIAANPSDDSITINSTDSSYSHDQIQASDVWTINHNLNKYPSVTIVDSAGSIVMGEVTYVSLNQIIIRFMAEFSGMALLN